MLLVLICAIGVGGATMIGAIFGYIFRSATERYADTVLAFAAGVSIAAAVMSLILPSLEYGGDLGLIITIIGIYAGALAISLFDKLLLRIGNMRSYSSEDGIRRGRVLLFVLAIALHNLPEGIAAGVGFGGDGVSGALVIALGIALQNLPEGMMIIAPMLSLGIKPHRALLYALMTGAVEVVGTFIGYFAVSAAEAILPFSLSFAGGTMLYVVAGEMIPETQRTGSRLATYALLSGFVTMLIFDAII